MAKKSENAIRNVAVSRYGWFVLLLSLVFIVIIYTIFKIKYAEGAEWRKLGASEIVKKDKEVPPARGSIYADDARLLAISEPLYEVYMDFMSQGMVKDTLLKYVTPLSEVLAKRYPDKTAGQYKKIILDGWDLSRKELKEIERVKKIEPGKRVKTRSGRIRIIRRDINYIEMKELYTFPFFNKISSQSGLFTETKTMRNKPFGRIAGRTVGSISSDPKKGGQSGLELKYDTILKGKPGIKTRQRVRGKWIDVILKEPSDGMDIKTTLNVDVQDLTEQALRQKLTETNAESGTAIVMEVATGEIKAIANLDRLKDGRYAEGNPNAFSYMTEPGSTFKTISLMIALEDGVVKPNDKIHVGDGLYDYRGRTVRDHDWRKGRDKGDISVAEGMYTSSNVAISKMILKGYESNPKKYVQHIHDMGLTKKLEWDVPLKGIEGTAIVRFPDDKSRSWYSTTLPWMSFGYETQIPPIYLLMFYNGIANGGKMIKPFLTKAFMKENEVVQQFEAEVVNPSLCSEATLGMVKDILRGVITEGTGKAAASDLFPIAGKTGTALIAKGGGYEGYYVSFCGYFPADNPQYTCFVGLRRPEGVPSGGGMAGTVFKTIAEGIYTRNLVSTPVSAPRDTLHAYAPAVKNGSLEKAKLVLTKLKQPFSANGNGEWIRAKRDTLNGGILFESNIPLKKGTVPNVIGMGARDAIYLLENAGLKVRLIGAGKVRAQSLNAGTTAVRGAAITIELN
ncbi:penicillin-binding protein [Dysgonomonas sp. 511]|uniref:penicillin-binding protein n=1 Tax=Dysgonomonas sp. 511 TaxID=2302930 RepID=UPI0013D11455|nr:penicillin-binding transpeptidase domain-containing protein [Dysgonomonas sp. 511]NDV79226.1 PASTA domain-containing protein [Dysgonomonas sp. 511]